MRKYTSMALMAETWNITNGGNQANDEWKISLLQRFISLALLWQDARSTATVREKWNSDGSHIFYIIAMDSK